MVWMASGAMCTFFLLGDIFTQNWRLICFRLEGVNQNRQFFIVDNNRLNAIIGSIAVISDNKGNFLSLEQNLAISQNHLLVTSQGRHPMQTKRL